MADFTIVRSLKRNADAAEHQAEQYRRAGRHDDADDAAKDGRRWRLLAAQAPELFAEADQDAALLAGINAMVGNEMREAGR